MIEAGHIQAWEDEHGELEPGEMSSFRTGWSDRYYRPLPEGFRYDRSHPAPGEDAISTCTTGASAISGSTPAASA